MKIPIDETKLKIWYFESHPDLNGTNELINAFEGLFQQQLQRLEIIAVITDKRYPIFSIDMCMFILANSAEMYIVWQQWTTTSLVQVVACRLHVTEPLP